MEISDYKIITKFIIFFKISCFLCRLTALIINFQKYNVYHMNGGQWLILKFYVTNYLKSKIKIKIMMINIIKIKMHNINIPTSFSTVLS